MDNYEEFYALKVDPPLCLEIYVNPYPRLTKYVYVTALSLYWYSNIYKVCSSYEVVIKGFSTETFATALQALQFIEEEFWRRLLDRSCGVFKWNKILA